MIEKSNSPLHHGQLAEPASRVLIVDNEKRMLELLTIVLSDCGLRVTACENGTDAIKRSLSAEFEYIITDYDMPGMNGIELTRRVRMMFPLAIIIGMSGSDRNIEFLSAGANDFLQKPFPAYTLATMVDPRRVQQ